MGFILQKKRQLSQEKYIGFAVFLIIIGVLCGIFAAEYYVSCKKNMMLLETLIHDLKASYPDQAYSVNEKERLLSITAQNDEVGGIDIKDDEYELTVYVGNFTHWHVGCYEEELSEEEKAKHISNQVIEFLSDLFNDQVVMWGSHEGGGGFYLKGEQQNSRKWFGLGNKRKEWVWSGPVNS